jgi:Ca2+-binding RTX toxin-like protein
MSTTIAARRGRLGLTDSLAPITGAQSVASPADQLSAARLAAFARTGGPAAPVHASPPPSIIPPPPPPPPTPNWTAPIHIANGTYTQAAGTYVYSTQWNPMIVGDYSPTLVNDGTIWMDGSPAPNTHSSLWQYNATVIADVVNHGTMVVRAATAPFYDQIWALVSYDFQKFTNTGQVYAWAQGGRALALLSYYTPSIVNSGLIAAYVDSGLAIGISVQSGGGIQNQAGGRILAEGPVAIAITFYNANLPFGWGSDAQVINAGLIQAASTNVDIASIGIGVSHASDQIFHIVNSGTITAEIAIIDQSSSEGNFSPVQLSTQIVTNQASGVINGDILLDRGNDQIDNSGRINGDVLLGEGNDRFDSTGGTINGRVDLGWGDDSFKGGPGTDAVAGAAGDDSIEGNGGNDELMGGSGADVLIGGAGNDGLFGELGNDRIVTKDGDFVWGGRGDDRIELGDYAFEHVSGNEGFDTLVLPAGARAIDLSAILAAHALDGIELIVLGGGKELVLRAADIPLVTDNAHVLRVDGIAGDTVDLVGAWTSAGTTSIGGVSYRQYQLGAESVLVSGSATVAILGSAPAGAAGLDPVAPGGLAPIPGDGPLDFTPTDFYLTSYLLTAPLLVSPEETLWNDVGAAVFNGQAGLTNQGHVFSTSALEVGVATLGSMGLINYGVVSAFSTWDTDYSLYQEDRSGVGVTAISYSIVYNHNLIESTTLHGLAVGFYRPVSVANDGEIHVYSKHGYAIGIEEMGALDNRGLILVEGGLSAIGLRYFGGTDGSVTGQIEAHILAGGSGESIGVQFRGSYVETPFTFTNNGQITADIALQEEQNVFPSLGGSRPLSIINNGILAGRVELSHSGDSVLNSGTITGAMLMGDGNDRFDGHAGQQTGGVHGGSGDDVIIGGAGADLLYGDDGNDTLTGGSGADILRGGAGTDYLQGGAGADSFQFTAPSDSDGGYWLRSDGAKGKPDVIVDFHPGEDKIDLSAIDAIAGTAANGAFVFIGSNAFSHHAGELRVEVHNGAAQVYADVDGDGYADFQLAVTTPTLQAGDFVL